VYDVTPERVVAAIAYHLERDREGPRTGVDAPEVDIREVERIRAQSR
jgi:hypothetical protein